MWQGQRLHVLQVWTEVPAQTELRVSPQEETQDRVRECGAVREQRTGRLHRKRKPWGQLLVASFRRRGLFSQGGQCDATPFKLLDTH